MELGDACGELKLKGHVGRIGARHFGFDFLTRNFEGGIRGGKALSGSRPIGRLAWDVFARRKICGDGMIGLNGPAAKFDAILARRLDVDRPKTLGFAFPGTDGAVVPWRHLFLRQQPVVRGEDGRIVGGVAERDLTVVQEALLHARPPIFVAGPERLDHLGVVLGAVGLLTDVGLNVVKFLAVDQAPAVRHHRGLAPFDRRVNALRVGDQRAIRPALGLALKERDNAGAVELHPLGSRQPQQLDEGRQDVDVGGETIHVAARIPTMGRPMDKEGHSVATIVLTAFLGAHAGIENFRATGGSVVGGENEDRIVSDPRFSNGRTELADVVIDVGDHAEKVGQSLGLVGIRGTPLRRAVHGTMGRIGGDVGEEGLLLLRLRLDPLGGLGEEHIGAEALGRNDLAVVMVGPVKVGVVPVVRRLAHTTAAVAIDFGEALVLGARWIVVAHVPLAVHGGGVSGFLENLRHRDLILPQDGTSVDRVPNPGSIGKMPGHQRRTRRAAGRGNMVVRQTHGLRMEGIQVGCLQHRVAVAGQIAVTLVVGDDDDDVGFVSSVKRDNGETQSEKDSSKHDQWKRFRSH